VHRYHSLWIAIGALAVVCAGGCGSGGSSNDSDPLRVSVAEGELEGVISGATRHFFGIPFAEPPVGGLRWRAPVRKAPWTELLQATELSAKCAQGTSLTSGPPSDEEDCLYLNVWTPYPVPARPLPVLFWIHGGGNENGSTRDETPIVGGLFYDGETIVEAHEVVVVSTNYRLGALGFFSHPELRAEGSPSGNQGLLDLRLALEWVRDNIEAFGGDPNNVTIFGESAGARNVCYQVVSPDSRGLFHRAISESGDCTGRITTQAEAEAQVDAYVAAVGCNEAADVLSCLRSLPAEKLIIDVAVEGAPPEELPGGSGYQGSTPLWDFGPTVDGAVVPAMPRASFAAGEVADVPYIVGTNTEEGALRHLLAIPVESEPEFMEALERAFGTADAAELAALYPVAEFPTPNDALIRVTTDWRYACAVQDFAERIAGAGLTVYAYNFDYPWAAPALRDLLGKSHGAELNYVFGSFLEGKVDEESKTLSELMQRYWTRFAVGGDPNGAADPTWSVFDPALGNRLNLNAGPSVVENFRQERCNWWKGYYDSLFE
jgi:para-nitrobenzyl esterase